jgi:crotonobetainyl-CoA:carnitine CoA-transferase CaiB-like acyl-CoA transferase
MPTGVKVRAGSAVAILVEYDLGMNTMTELEHRTQALRPLAGVRIVSIAPNVPGPVAVARLIALGATAVKVEPPAGDFLASGAPTWYDALRVGQTVLTLDLKRDDGRDALSAHLADADVFVTSHRPAALDRLGLSTDVLRARFPALCIVRVVGHAGADAERPGHDLTFQAAGGLMSPPALPTSLFADIATGEAAATAACALLVQRARTGRGDVIDVVMEDVAHQLAAPRMCGLTAPGGLLGGALPAYGVYAARDGWIALAALEPPFARRLTEGLGIDRLTERALTQAFVERSVAEWEAWGRAQDVPIAIVR